MQLLDQDSVAESSLWLSSLGPTVGTGSELILTTTGLWQCLETFQLVPPGERRGYYGRRAPSAKNCLLQNINRLLESESWLAVGEGWGALQGLVI